MNRSMSVAVFTVVVLLVGCSRSASPPQPDQPDASAAESASALASLAARMPGITAEANAFSAEAEAFMTIYLERTPDARDALYPLFREVTARYRRVTAFHDDWEHTIARLQTPDADGVAVLSAAAANHYRDQMAPTFKRAKFAFSRLRKETAFSAPDAAH